MRIAVHITHETIKKIGGIGAVLSGICNSQIYKDSYDKTVLYGPLFDLPADAFSHLEQSGRPLFSSHEHYDAGDYTRALDQITRKYNVDIVYGERKLVSEFDVTAYTTVEVINVGINLINPNEITNYKYNLWKNFDIESDQYRNDWDYEQYLRIAVPYLDILENLYGSDADYYHFAHEYMGIPSALSVLMQQKKHTTVFVAHEVTTARALVENHPGHDITFYNILNKADTHKTLEQVFGRQKHNPRNELVKRAVYLDHIFAVGDHVKAEYRFLVPQVNPEKIKLVYNGVSAYPQTFEKKMQAHTHIEQYIEALFNFKPDAIFTHVSRLVRSKAIWRDIELLYSFDKIFDAQNLKGAYILLSTLIGTPRAANYVFKMEREYGWPVLHRSGWPDLIGREEDIYDQMQIFNAKSKAIKAVFINQFGFGRSQCGKRVPAEAEFQDLRMASDAELGLSIYEPFGIAQIETIPFGGVAVLSSCCGAACLLKKIFKDASIKPFYILDYIAAGNKLSYNSLKNLTIAQRNQMEKKVASQHAKRIFDILPLTEEARKQYCLNARKYASHISWQTAAKNYLL
ncbi:MAG: hypothetical protein ACYSRR_01190 [Planctomycetota bacterium]|jgi:hypothetical protein